MMWDGRTFATPRAMAGHHDRSRLWGILAQGRCSCGWAGARRWGLSPTDVDALTDWFRHLRSTWS